MSEAGEGAPFAGGIAGRTGRTASPPARVERAGAEDVPELAALQAAVRGGSPDEWAERIDRVRRDERGVVIVARSAGRTIGYASTLFLPEHPDGAPAGYYLSGVTVVPARRRLGVGRSLTHWRLEWIWARAPVAWCFVNAGNAASLELHRSLGFRRVLTGPSVQGVGFTGGEGHLLRSDRPAPPGAGSGGPGPGV